jgi:hypothetical protein
MTDLERVFAPLRHVQRVPVTRDQAMLLMAALNEIFLGIDTFLAHSISGTIRPFEWIPILFGPAAGAVLLLAGLIAGRGGTEVWNPRRRLASFLASGVLGLSIVVGLLGAYFHLVRAILPTGPLGARVTVDLIVWAPPILGPLTFALVGLLGISAAWLEEPPGSGRLLWSAGRRIHLPYSKTRAFFFMVSLGTLATVISAVLDHARTHFENPWLWIPTLAGVFGTVVAASLGALNRPGSWDLRIYALAMTLLILVGVIGAWLHIRDNLAFGGTVVVERFIRGAPFLAPLLFCNMGALGWIVLMDPDELRRA